MRTVSRILVLTLVLSLMFVSIASAATGDIYIGNVKFTTQQLLQRSYQAKIDLAISQAGGSVQDNVKIDYGYGVYTLGTVINAVYSLQSGQVLGDILKQKATTTAPSNPIDAVDFGNTPAGPTGTYTITPVNTYASDFGVTVNNFDNALYFNVMRTSSDGTTSPLSPNAVAIGSKLRTMPQLFSNVAVLKVEFYSDAAGTTKVGTATLSDGTLTITKIDTPVNPGPTGTYSVTSVNTYASDFGVTVENLSNANYFNVMRTASDGTTSPLSPSAVAIGSKLRTMPQLFSNTSVLKVEFYSDAAGATKVATATLSNGTLTITKVDTPVTPPVTNNATGSYTITSVNTYASDFGVTVNNLSNANYFNVMRTASDGSIAPLSPSAVAIGSKLRTMPQLFSDTSVLKVEFYSDAAGTAKVGTATLSNGTLTITQ